MLELKDISRAFDGRQVLDRVSFDVEPGEFVSLIGPSGAGKSTLFNIIAGLDTPDSGQVRFDGSLWSARALDPAEVIPAGQVVTVSDIDGPVAVVWKDRLEGPARNTG